MRRTVSAQIRASVIQPAEIVFSVAVCGCYSPASETFSVTVDGAAIEAEEIEDRHRGRLHVVRPAVGELVLDYAASIDERAALEGDPVERHEYIRPSRYAESDRLFAVANDVFRDLSGKELLDAVVEWVHQHTSYVSGSSRHTDGAVDTYLSRKGVCRDFAHLVVAFLRGRNVPARLVSVYAPGLSPMDFHAVAEAYVDGAWHIVDATRLAPRESLVRIATGRDAADTAFMTVQGGITRFQTLRVTAVVEPELPSDDAGALQVLG